MLAVILENYPNLLSIWKKATLGLQIMKLQTKGNTIYAVRKHDIAKNSGLALTLPEVTVYSDVESFWLRSLPEDTLSEALMHRTAGWDDTAGFPA